MAKSREFRTNQGEDPPPSLLHSPQLPEELCGTKLEQSE